MTAKGIAIIILMVIALIFAIFVPLDSDDLSAGMSFMLLRVIHFLISANVLLCWIGAPAAWRFAENCGFVAWGRIVIAYIGVNFSLIVAIFELVKSRNDYLNGN